MKQAGILSILTLATTLVGVDGTDMAEARGISVSTTSAANMAAMNSMNMSNMLIMQAAILSSMEEERKTNMSVSQALKGPLSNLRECAFQEDIDLDALLIKAEEVGDIKASELKPENLGLSKSEAKALGDCTKNLRHVDKLVGAFSIALDKPTTTEQFNALKKYAGDEVTFELEDYEQGRATLTDIFAVGVSREDVRRFEEFTDDYLNSAEQKRRFIGAGLLGLVAFSALGFGYAVTREL